MNWKPGDKANIGYHICVEYIGCECVIITIHHHPVRVSLGDGTRSQIWNPVVELQIDGIEFPSPSYKLRMTPCQGYGCKPEWLRKPDEGLDTENDLQQKWCDIVDEEFV